MIITIDGSVATGKSTIAKLLAAEIGYIYFDTGAMYRSVTAALMQANVNPDDPEAMQAFLNAFRLDIKIKQGERRYIANDTDVTEYIRSPQVTAKVSHVSALPIVREKLVALQRLLAKNVNAVLEGRDMGTVVFPDADFKIFLTGRPDIRAKRRYEELLRKFPEQMQGITVEQILAQINERDKDDSERALSPLKRADDAFIVDTSDLAPDEVVFKLLEIRDSRKTRRSGATSEN